MTWTPTITPDAEPERVHRVWRAGWWPLAQAATVLGHDCTILDPDAEEVDVYYDGKEGHGMIRVVPHTALEWTFVVSGVETEQTED